jgi:hypothetical protein
LEFRISESEYQFVNFSTVEFKKKIRLESPESKMESKFRFQWGSQNLEPKIGIPNQGVDCKPTTECLQQTHGELQRHYLGPWQMLPWQYGAKMLGVGWRRLILFLFVVWELQTPENFLPAAKCYSRM